MALDALDASGEDGGLGGEEPSGPMASDAPLDDFETEIRAAFPDNDWTPDRVMAMKEAIRLYLEQDQEGGYDKPPPKKGAGGDVDLLLAFPGPKKRGG